MNTFAEFIAWETASKDCIDLKLIYVDIAGGDLVAGVLLSQIVFWHLPSPLTNKTKLRVKKKGHLWLAKGREDWWDECRISKRQFDRASKALVELGIIEKKNFMFSGMKTVHVRILQERFLELLNEHARDAYDAGVRVEEAFVDEYNLLVDLAEDAGGTDVCALEPVALERFPENEKPELHKQANHNREDLLVSLDKSKETLSVGKEKDVTKLCVRCVEQKAVSLAVDPHGRCVTCLFVDAWAHYIGRRTPRYSSNGDNKRKYIGSTSKIKTKMSARLKEPEFRKGWSFALERASHQQYLMENAWFNPEYFLRNDGQWRKLVDGVFDSFERDFPNSDLERWLARKQAGLAG